LTVAVGAFVVFFPMRMLLSGIVLQHPNDRCKEPAIRYLRSSILLLIGVIVALFAFFRHVPFLAIDIAQLLIAYGLLGGRWGLMSGEGSVQTAHKQD
jgi:hypothetical protein